MTKRITRTDTHLVISDIPLDLRPLLIRHEATSWLIGELGFFLGYYTLVYPKYIYHPMVFENVKYHADVSGDYWDATISIRAESYSVINFKEAIEILSELDPEGRHSRTTHVLHLEKVADGFDLKCTLTAPTGEAFDYHLPVPGTHAEFFTDSLCELLKYGLRRVKYRGGLELRVGNDSLRLHCIGLANLPTCFACLECPDGNDYRMSFTLEMVREVLHALAPEKVPPEAWQEDLSKVLLEPFDVSKLV